MPGNGKVYCSRIVYAAELDRVLNEMAEADHWWLERIVPLLSQGEGDRLLVLWWRPKGRGDAR